MGQLDRMNPQRFVTAMREQHLRPEGFELRVDELARRQERGEPLWDRPLPGDEIRRDDPRYGPATQR